MASISIRDLMKVHKHEIQLNHVSLEVDDGEFVVLVGPKHSGKTALLRVIAGLEKCDSGEIYFNNRRVTDRPPQLRNIGMVFQKDALFPAMTVADNLGFALKMRKLEKERIEKRVAELAELLHITHLLKKKPHELEMIDRQRVAIARALAPKPDILLMDDPLVGLDDNNSRELGLEILRLQRALNFTALYVTRNRIEGLRMATRVVVMHEGTIQQCDAPQIIYDYPANRYVGKFIGTPEMKQFPVKLVRYGKEVFMEFGENKIPLPAGKVSRMAGDYYIGKTVILGMRAENIHDDAMFLSISEETAVDAEVTIVEMMGMGTYLHLNVEGIPGELIANVEARSTAREGETIRIAFDVNHVHLFDAETGASIMGRIVPASV